ASHDVRTPNRFVYRLRVQALASSPRPLSNRGRFADAIALKIAPAIRPQTAAPLSTVCKPEGLHTGAVCWQDVRKSLASSFFGAVKEQCVYRSSPLKSMGQSWDTAGKTPLLRAVLTLFRPLAGVKAPQMRGKSDGKTPLKIAAFYRRRYGQLGMKVVLKRRFTVAVYTPLLHCSEVAASRTFFYRPASAPLQCESPQGFHTGNKAATLLGRFAGAIISAIVPANHPSVNGPLGKQARFCSLLCVTGSLAACEGCLRHGMNE
ncbi:hypothetical protein AB205_0086020, partial [Aquarana catesbeiana]